MIDTLITSQDYLSDEIVAAKRDAADYAILVSPAFVVDGRTVRVLLDGHHSLAAALETGAEPDVTEADETAADTIGLLNSGDIEGFLAACWMDGDYHYVVSGKSVW